MYTIENRVRFSEVDHTERMTLPGVINYFQDCSIFQSEDLGVGLGFLAAHQRGWVLSAWQIVVNRYPKLGEHISVSTWATGFEGLYGTRNFIMKDKEGETAAYANSIWVFMDMKKGRPARPKEEEISPYGVEEKLEMEYAPRKIALPSERTEKEAFPVRRYHIDTNEHVNNCQYVQMALEMISGERRFRQLRVEYKKSAVYGDIIYPKTAKEEDRTVIELCDCKGTPYAIIELTGEQ